MAKQAIFTTDRDRVRFLFSILYFQSSHTFRNTDFYTTNFSKYGYFDNGKTSRTVCSDRNVELVSFCLMPNHFHLLMKEKTEGGIARYMQRVQNSYTKYFNIKYKKSGHLFQGPYRAVHVADNEQLLHLSAYIHRNPIELARTDEHSVFISKYKWSSLQDYVNINRWGELLEQQIILGQFKGQTEYSAFIKTSTTKEFERN